MPRTLEQHAVQTTEVPRGSTGLIDVTKREFANRYRQLALEHDAVFPPAPSRHGQKLVRE